MFPISQTHLTPRTLVSIVAIVLVIALFVVYTLFQARLLILGPQVALTGDYSLVQTERTVTLTGSAKNITEISLNGRPIVTSEAGIFKETIILENGYNRVRIQAHDRYGRTTSLERTFVYTPLSLLPN